MDISDNKTPKSTLNVDISEKFSARSYNFTAIEVDSILKALFPDVSKSAIAREIGLSRPALDALMVQGTKSPALRAKFHIACRKRAEIMRKNIRQAQKILD